MSALKTVVTNASAESFLAAIPDETKRSDSMELLRLFTKVTGEQPKMWGTSIVGFGQYHYKSERSSQEGDWMLTGFSPRKQSLTLYVIAGFDDLQDLLGVLGKHKVSVGCLYVNKLADIDMAVLEKIIAQSYFWMKARNA